MASCASRSRQSPINLVDLDAPASMTFTYGYQPISSPFQLKNNGHAYSAELAGLGIGGITYENAWYDLLTINVHAESEHTFAGRHTPLELHLVHKRYDGHAVLIVAIPIDSLNSTDVNANPVLQTFLKVPLPLANANTMVPGDEVNPIDLNVLLSGSKYFEYAGSLSAPPCAEIATWLVRRDALAEAQPQVQALHDAVLAATGGHGNFRAVMPLNGRTVGLREAVAEDAPVAMPREISIATDTSSAMEGREARAEGWAKDALSIARASADYVRDLDRRIHSAAEAHAGILAPTPFEQAPAQGDGSNLSAFPMPGGRQGPLPARGAGGEQAAQALGASIAAAAKQAVEEAVGRISAETQAIAMKAAQDAARAVVREMAEGRSSALRVGAPPA